MYSFILDSEKLSKLLNYQLPNSFRVAASQIYKYNKHDNSITATENLKTLIDLKCLCLQLDVPIILSIDNTGLLLGELESMIHKLHDVTAIKDFEKTVHQIIIQYDEHLQVYRNQIESIYSLLEIKQILISNNQPVKFILDTSALIEEPDLLQKFFRGKTAVVHSIIKDELELQRGTNFNAIRALRNINVSKNDPKVNLEMVQDEIFEHNSSSYQSNKVKHLEQLMENCFKDGKRPILVSNDESNFHLYEYKHKDIIQLKQLALIIS